MATTATQSRLLTLARFHPATRGRWPEATTELRHHATTPAIAVSLYALRTGYGYCVAWIHNGMDGLNLYSFEEDAREYFDRAVRDMEASKPA